MCYFSRLFVIQLKIKIPQTNNCNFDFYVTLNFTEYILWIKHKPQIKYQYILLVDSTFYHILFSDSSECRNNMFKDQFVCCLPVIICSVNIKRLRLGKTTGWQHRFFDLTILSPIWLGTYECMKSSLENFFFRFETGLPEWIFQIWSKIFKSDQVFVYTKKSLF